MKRIVVAVVASVLLGLPAEADITSMQSERDQIFQKIMSGQETDADVARFQDLTTQINSTLSGKFQEHSAAVSNMMDKLQVMEQHKQQVYQSLFGNTPAVVTSPGALPSTTPRKLNLAVPVALSATPQLTGNVTNNVLAPIYKTLLNKNGLMAEANLSIAKYSTTFQKVLAQSKDSFNYLYPYRGLGPPSEAGDIVLGEQLKINGLPAALLNQQMIVDKAHLSLTESFLQYASDPSKVPQGLSELSPEEFNNIKVAMAPVAVEKVDWDVETKQNKYRELVKAAVDADPTITAITNDVHKYNHRSKIAMNASHIIMPALGVASMVPMFIGPVARTALLAYVMMTGGPNEVQILKELYMDKRLESRTQVIAEEAHLALDAYQLGGLTNNPSLQTAGETIMNQLAPAETVQELLK